MADGDTPDTLAGAQDPTQQQNPIAGTPVNLPQPQQQQPIRAPNLADYRMPLIAKLISGIANANKPMPNQQPGQPPMMRPSRLDAFEDFLGNFMYSLSQGMAASGHGPGANIRGAAAAIGAPMQRDVQQYGLNQNAANMQAQREAEQSRTALTQAQTSQIISQVDTPYGPMSQAAWQRLVEKLGPAEIAAKGKVEAEKIGQRFKVVPGVGLIDTSLNGGKGGVVPGSESSIKVTPEMAQQYNIPQEVVGRTMPLNSLAAFERAGAMQVTPVQGAGGPALVNKISGQVRQLGLGAPSMGGIAIIAGEDGNPQYVPKSQAVGASPGTALNATERVKIQTNDKALMNAIPRMENIQKNADVISNLIDSGRISFAIGADGTLQAAIGRGVNLTPREAKFAADFQSMTEDINLLRGPMGATGFRSEEAFQALQAQRGRLAQNPDVFKGVIENSLNALRGLHDVNQNALQVKGGGGGGKGALTVDEARIYLNRAGGDKDKARAMAKKDGRSF